MTLRGGGSLAAGLVDELRIHLVPVLLGRGVRLFDDPSEQPSLFEHSQVVEAPGVAHLAYTRPPW